MIHVPFFGYVGSAAPPPSEWSYWWDHVAGLYISGMATLSGFSCTMRSWVVDKLFKEGFNFFFFIYIFILFGIGGQ